MIASRLPRLRVVVLAAGFSSRLGQPKALARVHGLSLLRRTLLLAATLGAAELIAVVPRRAARYRNEARGLQVRFVANSQRAEGLSSSVRRAIRCGRYASMLLLLPVDLVDLKGNELGRLVSRSRASLRRVTARRVAGGGAAPLLLPRWLFGRALRIAGDVGMRDLLREMPSRSLNLVDVPSAERDIDTLQELQTARRRFGAQQSAARHPRRTVSAIV